MSGYIGNIPTPQATQTRESFTATASQTTFNTAGYTPNFLDVFLNGVHLLNGTDYTATNGSDVVLTTGAAASDVVEVISYSTYEVNAQTYTGGLTVNNDGATVLTVDRATSTGKIVDVKSGGTSVGSVGAHAGFITLGSGDTSLIFDSTSNTIEPFNQNDLTSEDAAITLGWSSNRFKDLYLSGGVYLGGTGAANKLDDYEEGTWTPVVKFSAGGSTMTYSTDYVFRGAYSTSDTDTLTYTKIGNRVFVGFSFWSNTSGSYRFNISLPFTYVNTPYQLCGACSFYSVNTDGGIGFLGIGNSGSSFDTFAVSETGAHSNVPLTSASEVYYNFSYETS